MCQSAADGSIAVTCTLRLTDRGKTLYIYIKRKRSTQISGLDVNAR